PAAYPQSAVPRVRARALREGVARHRLPLPKEQICDVVPDLAAERHRRILERNSDAMIPGARCRAARPCPEGSESRNRLSGAYSRSRSFSWCAQWYFESCEPTVWWIICVVSLWALNCSARLGSSGE